MQSLFQSIADGQLLHPDPMDQSDEEVDEEGLALGMSDTIR